MLNLKRHYILHRTAVEGCDDVKSTLLLVDFYDEDKEKKTTFLLDDLRFIWFPKDGGWRKMDRRNRYVSHTTRKYRVRDAYLEVTEVVLDRMDDGDVHVREVTPERINDQGCYPEKQYYKIRQHKCLEIKDFYTTSWRRRAHVPDTDTDYFESMERKRQKTFIEYRECYPSDDLFWYFRSNQNAKVGRCVIGYGHAACDIDMDIDVHVLPKPSKVDVHNKSFTLEASLLPPLAFPLTVRYAKPVVVPGQQISEFLCLKARFEESPPSSLRLVGVTAKAIVMSSSYPTWLQQSTRMATLLDTDDKVGQKLDTLLRTVQIPTSSFSCKFPNCSGTFVSYCAATSHALEVSVTLWSPDWPFSKLGTTILRIPVAFRPYVAEAWRENPFPNPRTMVVLGQFRRKHFQPHLVAAKEVARLAEYDTVLLSQETRATPEKNTMCTTSIITYSHLDATGSLARQTGKIDWDIPVLNHKPQIVPQLEKALCFARPRAELVHKTSWGRSITLLSHFGSFFKEDSLYDKVVSSKGLEYRQELAALVGFRPPKNLPQGPGLNIVRHLTPILDFLSITIEYLMYHENSLCAPGECVEFVRQLEPFMIRLVTVRVVIDVMVKTKGGLVRYDSCKRDLKEQIWSGRKIVSEYMVGPRRFYVWQLPMDFFKENLPHLQPTFITNSKARSYRLEVDIELSRYWPRGLRCLIPISVLYEKP